MFLIIVSRRVAIIAAPLPPLRGETTNNKNNNKFNSQLRCLMQLSSSVFISMQNSRSESCSSATRRTNYNNKILLLIIITAQLWSPLRGGSRLCSRCLCYCCSGDLDGKTAAPPTSLLQLCSYCTWSSDVWSWSCIYPYIMFINC